MNKTKIEWTDYTWNPVVGCTKVSPGCKNCYAERMAKRLAGRCGYPKDEPFRVTLHPERLEEPLKLRKSSRIFVCSMSDLFHHEVPGSFIIRVFDEMLKTNSVRVMEGRMPHIFFLLTKRPEKMRRIIADIDRPLRRIWFGVSVENQETADARIPILLQAPAAHRFVSIEPMLGPMNLTSFVQSNCSRCRGQGRYLDQLGHRTICSDCRGTGNTLKLDWVIVGAETGTGARPMNSDWARDIRDQCVAAGVPFFLKKLNSEGDRILDGRTWEEMPRGGDANESA